MSHLLAISPIDGRYFAQTVCLQNYFSEYALIKYRLIIEIEYFFYLEKYTLFKTPASFKKKVYAIIENFNIEEAQKIKDIELVTNHDVKAVEYYLKQKIDSLNGSEFKEWVHFGLTSQDINNTAIPLSLHHFLQKEFIPQILSLIDILKKLSKDWKNQPMLSRTHGQAASPTLVGKEILVFVERLEVQLNLLNTIPNKAKFGGAVGNFNAHFVSFPTINWIKFGNDFVQKKLGLSRSQFTTQIEHYDCLAAICNNIERIHVILVDFCRDIWQYISMDYFKQKINSNEIGSSAMPHKVNPIDFENAEGNLAISNANLHFLSTKLPISRLQRDLTDSTVLRNLGVPFAHSIIAINSIKKGLNKLIINVQKIELDLSNNWIVIAEAIQTILRREKYPNPYEALKQFTRNNHLITQEKMNEFIDSLKISNKIKTELKQITPFNYVGKSPK
ncbi:MAG: adenylosuccinate lyase [Sediminibacterium sp.]|nr:adenylosuccinate lyase [Sediminibacterium sp.]